MSCPRPKPRSSNDQTAKRASSCCRGDGWSTHLAWLNRCRRLAKDLENLNLKARAFLLLASIRLMVRRLCRIENVSGQ